MKVDIAIVGNGILAMTTARALNESRPDLSVAVIGPAERTGGATGASGAMLNVFAEITNRSEASPAAIERFRIACDSLRRWPDYLEQLNAELPSESRCGSIPEHLLSAMRPAGAWMTRTSMRFELRLSTRMSLITNVPPGIYPDTNHPSRAELSKRCICPTRARSIAPNCGQPCNHLF